MLDENDDDGDAASAPPKSSAGMGAPAPATSVTAPAGTLLELAVPVAMAQSWEAAKVGREQKFKMHFFAPAMQVIRTCMKCAYTSHAPTDLVLETSAPHLLSHHHSHPSRHPTSMSPVAASTMNADGAEQTTSLPPPSTGETPEGGVQALPNEALDFAAKVRQV